jgi:hypothetical protein
MTLQELNAVLEGKKIQDSANPDELVKTLQKLGFQVEKKSSFYLINGGKAIAVDAEIYASVNNDEIEAQDLYSTVETELIEYQEGDLLTANSNSGNKYTFIFLEELNDGTLLGLGMFAGGLSNRPMRYTKKLCHKASASEISHFKKVLAENNSWVRITGSRIDTFYLRKRGQSYYSVRMNFNTKEFVVQEYVEEHEQFDTEMFESGNYFKSSEAAMEAVKGLRVEDAVQD